MPLRHSEQVEKVKLPAPSKSAVFQNRKKKTSQNKSLTFISILASLIISSTILEDEESSVVASVAWIADNTVIDGDTVARYM